MVCLTEYCASFSWCCFVNQKYISFEFAEEAGDLQSFRKLVAEEAVDTFNQLVRTEILFEELFETLYSYIEQSLVEEQCLRDISGKLNLWLSMPTWL